MVRGFGIALFDDVLLGGIMDATHDGCLSIYLSACMRMFG